MNDNLIPHDEAEKNVLGAMLLRREALEELTAILEPGDFYKPAHETIYTTALSMHHRGDAVDALTLSDELTKAGNLARCGGILYLHELTSIVPTTANVGFYARIVAEQAIRRRLHTVGMRVTQLAAGGEGDVHELVETCRTEIDSVSRATATTGWVSTDLDETIQDLEQPTPTVPTPWPDLNHLIGGWAPGRLYIIGARPAVGKSLVAVNAAAALAATGPVAFNTLEMSRQEIHHRLVSSIAGVPMTRLTEHRLNTLDWQHIAEHRAELDALQLSIDDRSAITATDVASHARTVARKAPVAAVFVDYIQLMASHTRTENRQQEVAAFSRRLKLLARELACPVIALSQLNRGLESRADKHPTMADLRESGALEQDADVVLLLHVEENRPDLLQMAVAKNRHGQTGAIELEREGALARVTPARWRPHQAGL